MSRTTNWNATLPPLLVEIRDRKTGQVLKLIEQTDPRERFCITFASFSINHDVIAVPVDEPTMEAIGYEWQREEAAKARLSNNVAAPRIAKRTRKKASA